METTRVAFDPSYPVGRFHWKSELTESDRAELMGQIAEAPAHMREAASGLTERQLDTPYRPGGWTARQVIHHVPDSHLNAYVRFKLALTEDEPTIKPYDQERWAELADTKTTPVETSLKLLESLHGRWVNLLRSMAPADFSRRINHPELGVVGLDWMLAHYAWHGRHHVGHVISVRNRVASQE